MRFSRLEYWNELPFPSPMALPNSGIKPLSLSSPALSGRFFTTRATWTRWSVQQRNYDSLYIGMSIEPDRELIFTDSTLRARTLIGTLYQFSSVQFLIRVRLFATPWIAARQASLASLRLTSIESVMPSSYLILCRPLLLLPPIPPSIRVFSNESTLHEVAKVLELHLLHQSFQWIFRTKFL